MKTTQADVLFHMIHAMPAWAIKTVNEKCKPKYGVPVAIGLPFNVSIDQCINGRSPEKHLNKKENVSSLHNTLSLLSGVRRNIASGAEKRSFVEYLSYLSVHGAGCPSADRRIWSKRFLRKIAKATKKPIVESII